MAHQSCSTGPAEAVLCAIHDYSLLVEQGICSGDGYGGGWACRCLGGEYHWQVPLLLQFTVGSPPRVGMSARGIRAHDATNLFYRGHSHPLQALTTAVIAHGELQERPVGKNSHSPCADGFPPVIL